MLRKIAAVGMLALCLLASGCWFNSPCCSPYDKAGPTFGTDPSIPNDFNYRKGSILGSDYSAGAEYMDDGVEYMPDDGAASDSYEQQPQPMSQYMPQEGFDAQSMPEQELESQYTSQQESDPRYTPQSGPSPQSTRYPRQQTPVDPYSPQPRRFGGLFRGGHPTNRGAGYQGMRDQDAGYQDATYEDTGYPRSDYQGTSTYRTGTNPRFRSQRGDRGVDPYEAN